MWTAVYTSTTVNWKGKGLGTDSTEKSKETNKIPEPPITHEGLLDAEGTPDPQRAASARQTSGPGCSSGAGHRPVCTKKLICSQTDVCLFPRDTLHTD